MKNLLFLTTLLFFSFHFSTQAQDEPTTKYWQVKVDFLEPVINQGYVARLDYGFNRHLVGLVAGVSGRVSEFDNKQFETFDDKTIFRVGAEYQFFLSAKKVNRGFYVGADIEYSQHKIISKKTVEEVSPIGVVTPGAWVGFLWKPFKKANFMVDLTIFHPRYNFGSIKEVSFKTTTEKYKPENLFNFLGPWSIGWRF